ncbi:enoyl-[acyl-carrier protein] reductase I [Daejeonella rubra]|uniref:Enoyl-[acyl-carrier-protein] reductase [NADH] n=1 Tax=Daejeonella rubra TaxID=990371 RepID=A0A1G9Z4L9_9SPHI|nr:SDR family oxidoreductase [Daejeonella rubra]SDN15875.1 enoyl-[acyl-carrier protein] reductase I [Daejeonella rubra]
MINNKDKVAIVFGVRNDSSIAWNVALKLHMSGSKVALSYVEDTKDEVLALMEKNSMDSNYAAQVDVRSSEQIDEFLNKVYNGLGPINYILHGVAFGNQNVLCYTIPGSSEAKPSYLDIPFEDLMDSFNISAYSLLRICRSAKDLLSDNASILTLTYNASRRVFPGYAGMGINKAALENIVLYLADHFRGQNIRVNAVSAGLVMTTSSGAISGVRKLRKFGKLLAPLGNVSADDVGNAALYYFSDLSAKVTGNLHFVDGGFNIMGVPNDEE